mmetsp:Transcript_5155/g.14181  ORF Transcript_5155/g.14181 Transcript_5155/m.14181 type:complete len:277 (-) Transcript_5155:12-842(-)
MSLRSTIDITGCRHRHFSGECIICAVRAEQIKDGAIGPPKPNLRHVLASAPALAVYARVILLVHEARGAPRRVSTSKPLACDLPAEGARVLCTPGSIQSSDEHVLQWGPRIGCVPLLARALRGGSRARAHEEAALAEGAHHGLLLGRGGRHQGSPERCGKRGEGGDGGRRSLAQVPVSPITDFRAPEPTPHGRSPPVRSGLEIARASLVRSHVSVPSRRPLSRVLGRCRSVESRQGPLRSEEESVEIHWHHVARVDACEAPARVRVRSMARLARAH